MTIVIYHMPIQDNKVRVNARISQETYDKICQIYDSMTQAINDGLELLINSNAHGHTEYDNIRHPEIHELRARIDDLKNQIQALNNQLESKDEHIHNLTETMQAQAVHVQTLLNQRLIETPGAKKPWWQFW